ncbi:MAG: UvrD-helicase domain-containing protein [Terracidiphilus sp.]
MPDAPPGNQPPDQSERERALDSNRSILVRAPAGSGKTDLLTRRFLRLLGEVDDPGQIVAITFTKAAANEMCNRILSEIENAAQFTGAPGENPFSMQALAHRALARSQALGWNLLDLSAQLRISTIDSFCRELALQKPLLSGLGGTLDISEQPTELYRRAARRTLEQIDNGDPALRQAIELLLLWRDNSWADLESQLVAMLAQRDRWMHGFVLDRDPDWDALREQLQRPFAREVHVRLAALSALIDQVPGAREEALALARFACEQSGGQLNQELAELAEFPAAPFHVLESLEEARQAHMCLARLLLTNDGAFRRQVNVSLGFPKERKAEKTRLLNLIASLLAVPTLESNLASAANLPPSGYTDEEWQIVRACFTVLRHAAAELRVVFAESAAADYTEVAQIALNVLKSEDGFPTDAALAVADRIRHLLVDEFQDTSRRQHQLLAHLIAAWSQREGRTCFVVGDPMQSIYSFRDADAELFPRVERIGLEIPNDPPLLFDSVLLQANFRSAAPLVESFNDAFAQIFAVDDGSGITYTSAVPARNSGAQSGLHLVAEPAPRMNLHLEFIPNSSRANSRGSGPNPRDANAAERKAAHQKQIQEIVALIRSHLPQAEKARAENERNKNSSSKKQNYGIAVLGRARKSLAPIALALREAAIPFRAVELEELQQRPEIIDALSLARALLNPQDRVSWLGVLRAPWCGLSLADLYALVSADNADLLARPIPVLLTERKSLLSADGQVAIERLQRAIEFTAHLRSTQPAAALGTWLEQVWLRLGGAQCADAAARANLDLFWKSLDNLPQGEPDLLGSALDAALERLTAQPDPAADSDCGIQLMTIHKSKGLEFEVVIVPDLQVSPRHSKHEMLSWLELGIPPGSDPGDSGEITEFLVAPFQSKGAQSSAAKKWVDRVRGDRESQETRRILYVAATRAREELRLFARPSYKTAQDGSLTLADPRNSLLATAWPAFENEIRARFDAWRAQIAQTAEPATIDSLAASAAVNLRSTVPPIFPALLRRLPSDFAAAHPHSLETAPESALVGAGRLYERHEGGLLSRALGLAVHAFLQQLAQLLASQSSHAIPTLLAPFEPRIAAQVRAAGVDPTSAKRIAAQALQIALHAAADPLGNWILAPHADAASEVRWTGIVNGVIRTVQVDRVFRAGHAPQSANSASNSSWWIVDYKTAHEDMPDPASALPGLRRVFAPQIEAYAKVLRNLYGVDAPVLAGLYYPRMSLFDWWQL